MSRETTERTGREYHIYLTGEQVARLNRIIDRQYLQTTGRFKRPTGTKLLTAYLGALLLQLEPDND